MDDGSEPPAELCGFSLESIALNAIIFGTNPMSKINVNEVSTQDYMLVLIVSFIDSSIPIDDDRLKHIDDNNHESLSTDRRRFNIDEKQRF